jgi:hypothetical protein
MVSQPGGHGWCIEPPAFRCACSAGRQGLGQRLAQAGLWPAKVVVRLIQAQLLASAVLACAARDDAPADRRHMLANRAIRPLDDGRVDLPARRGQHLFDLSQGTEHHAVAHADHTSAPRLFDHLRIAPRGPRPPAGLGSGAWSLASR